jgi:nickel superoxide dismutase
MHAFIRSSLRLLDRLSPPPKAHAHCDIPCGIYDPHLAQIAALTCIRMDQLIAEKGQPGPDMARYVAVKEHHAELAKHEVRIIWGDYIKPEHSEKHPDVHRVVFNIMKLGSKVRQGTDIKDAEALLADIQKFAEIFWATKDVQTKRVPSNQGAAGGELVVPA